ncbi:MAG: cytochrome b N-terminal domain-containing protein [Proteobacteria bacterium]|nr:cytochrome b N-terminal domain-containing protein [Pseudomonadota bacterium]MBU1713084.1 cytochrome b N-terminal domain-containing protein [Pseudomonadota bacterium]
MLRLGDFIGDRIGWNRYLKPFMYEKLPSDMGWLTTLGSLCALIFMVEAATGMFLAMYYNPSPELAYESILYIMNDVTMGRMLRGVHHWGAGAMVILVFVHMATNFFTGAFKAPRELTWVVGVVILLITLGFGFTGYLLPWDQKAYWATVVSANIPGDIPVIGDFITRIMLGGDRVSGLTLTRFYAIHMLLLPGLMGLCIVLHIYLVRIHGMAGNPAVKAPGAGKEQAEPRTEATYRFYPEHLSKCAVAFAVVLSVVMLLAFFCHVPLEDMAGTLDESYLPRPEWYYMWLFQLLTFFSGSSEVVGSLVIPAGGILILILMPWLSRTNFRRVSDRPLATAVGTACIIGIVYLTIMGFAGTKPYGKIIPVPDRELNLSEASGLKVFVNRECAYCHNINGRGGRIQGPDLANMVRKKRTRDQLMKYIRDPQSVSRWSIMPKYDLNEKDLISLADFILTLDFKTNRMRIIDREMALEVAGGNQRE